MNFIDLAKIFFLTFYNQLLNLLIYHFSCFPHVFITKKQIADNQQLVKINFMIWVSLCGKQVCTNVRLTLIVDGF